MTESRTSGYPKLMWSCLGLCLICALLVKPAQDYVQSRAGNAGQDPDLLLFHSPKLIKKMSLGYDRLMGDFYWMRVIQYYGRREEAEKRPIRFKNLYTLLDITTTLDPDLIDAYRAGSGFLSEPAPIGAGQPEKALQLLDKGIREHPQDWRLVYDKGFVYYLYLKDYKAAGETWLTASRIPQSPEWLPKLAAVSFSKGGAFEVAVALWQRQYQEATQPSARENARNHLMSLQVARDLELLASLVERYRSAHGFFPHELQDLSQDSAVQFPIKDPLGTPYDYNPITGTIRLSPDTHVVYLN
jgi:tetratricopeptide (TPR) repeat protein